jgi:CRISPR-associated protein Csb1
MPGGVSISGALRNGWLSLSGLERIRFGDASAPAVQAARATLAALALAGDRLAFGRPSMWLRSGCDLARDSEVIAFEEDGGRREEFTVTTADAVAAFQELRERTAAEGIAMRTDTIPLEPSPSLAKAIEFSASKAGTQE